MSEENKFKNSTTNQSTENIDTKNISSNMNKKELDINQINKSNKSEFDKSFINMPKDFKTKSNNLSMINSFSNDIQESSNKENKYNITERTIYEEINQAEKNIDKMENFNNLSYILKNKNNSDIYKNLENHNNFLFNNINKEDKNLEPKNHLDKGFIMENSQNSRSGNSDSSKKDDKIYKINKKIENIKHDYVIRNNNLS